MHMGLLHKWDVTCKIKQLVEICHVYGFGVFHNVFCGFTSQVQLFCNNEIQQALNCFCKSKK